MIAGRKKWSRRFAVSGLMTVALLGGTVTAGELLKGFKKISEHNEGQPVTVKRRCLTPRGNDQKLGSLPRSTAWSLPSQALPADFDTTINCLVLRFNFQKEQPDDPGTTGDGEIVITDRKTTQEWLDTLGYRIDVPPHDSFYFDAHMHALNRYWETVSEGKIHLKWDIYPPFNDSAYTLPNLMAEYGKCDFQDVVGGLERFFIDCIQLADTAHRIGDRDSAAWDIRFMDSAYAAVFLFHAGSDRQSDMGALNNTCRDLFAGFIRFGDILWVDDSTCPVNTALMMPETCIQDGRIAALNAVMAHEFGHQLGLVDLYSTAGFVPQLGDFALMDGNGLGSVIEFAPFDFQYRNVRGTVPVFPSAWSRAYLGLTEVQDFRYDTNLVSLVAAACVDNSDLKIARIPITETEYYLLEVRAADLGIPGEKAIRTDSDSLVDASIEALSDTIYTYVIQGPTIESINGSDTSYVFSGEYDMLIPSDPNIEDDPGNGLLIYHVDEAVAQLDYSGNGENNFQDNHLQWWIPGEDRKFVALMEADGRVDFGGYYAYGYGSEYDMYREDRFNSFTPNSNPPAIDNSGNNTRIRIENIRRDTLGGIPQDTLMHFRLSFQDKAEGFPVRVGTPGLGLGPITDDLNGDDTLEVIVASGRSLSVITAHGDNFIRSISDFTVDDSLLYYDTVRTYINDSTSSVNPNPDSAYPVHPVPLYARTPSIIQAGPVTGEFGSGSSEKLVAVGYLDFDTTVGLHGEVMLYAPTDTADSNARADTVSSLVFTEGQPLALSFGDTLWALTVDFITDTLRVYRQTSLAPSVVDTFVLGEHEEIHGMCRIGGRLIVVAGDAFRTYMYYIGDRVYDYSLSGHYKYGPIVADMDRASDSLLEMVMFTPEGDGLYTTIIDTVSGRPGLDVLSSVGTGYRVSVNPIVGDVDLDGMPDVIIGGQGYLYAYNSELVMKSGFPLEVDDRYPGVEIIAPPVMADIEDGGQPELVFPTEVGNFYSYGPDRTTGFPLSSGEQVWGFSGSSAVVFHDRSFGKLGYIGGDGWFYAWNVSLDVNTCFWPMNGGDAHGTYSFRVALPTRTQYAEDFPESLFYNWPNPVENGFTNIRYFLGREASSVSLNIFDLSGKRIAGLDGTTTGGQDNQVPWNCSDVRPGVYRCVIQVDFDGASQTAFTDIAVIR